MSLCRSGSGLRLAAVQVGASSTARGTRRPERKQTLVEVIDDAWLADGKRPQAEKALRILKETLERLREEGGF